MLSQDRDEQVLGQEVALIYKQHSAQLLAALVRFFGPQNFQLAEDSLQDAFTKALLQWAQAMPQNPVAWLMITAKNQAIDVLRAQKKLQQVESFSDFGEQGIDVNQRLNNECLKDDQLRMIFMCCHPSIKAENRIPLILKTLCGFTIAAISRALVVPETTIKKRLFRTRESLNSHVFDLPPPDKMSLAMDSVHTVLYLLFNEGFHSSDNEEALNRELCRDALGLVNLLLDEVRLVNQDTVGLYALMHFHMARIDAKVDQEGRRIPINLQDRRLWDPSLFDRAVALLDKAPSLRLGASGRFVLEAQIAKHHGLALRFTDTDWQSIVSLYRELVWVTRSPVAELNLAIALAYAGDTQKAIQNLHVLCGHRSLKKSFMVWAALAHVYALTGQRALAYENAYKAKQLGGTPHEHHLMMQQLERLLGNSQGNQPI